MSDYAHPESLVSTQWVADRLNDTHVRPVEIVWGSSPDYGLPAYERGHIPGAVAWDFVRDLQDTVRGDVMDRAQAEALLERSGITPDSTIVVYSGLQNLLATYAFWLLRTYRHRNVRLLDGDRQKWLDQGLPLAVEQPVETPTVYRVPEPNWSLRVDRDQVLRSIDEPGRILVDARSPEMFAGVDRAGTARGGHIPGAINVPAVREVASDGSFRAWRVPTVRSDGTFKTVEELRAVFEDRGITPDRSIITYCVRGGLSTHTWFALTQLLGYSDVREYDRSWVEWGDLAEVPIEP